MPGSADPERERELYARTLRGLASALPGARVTQLLAYLEAYPLGVYNRDVTERAERALDSLPDTPMRALLWTRLHSLRDPYLPALNLPSVASSRPSTWPPPAHPRLLHRVPLRRGEM